MKKPTVIVSLDMECDIGSWSSQTRGLTEGTPEILRVLASHQVPATFLFTGREALAHPGVVESVAAGGHEIGCHTMFHETVGDPVYQTLFGEPLPHEIRPRLEMATAAVEKVAGIRPVSFRAPRLFGSTIMANALEDLGYRVDSTFPCYFHQRDFSPYHPSREDWSRPGNMNLLEVPLFYDMDGQEEGIKRRGADQWPMMRLRGGQWFYELCNRMRDRSPVLCVYLHPWEFVPMPEQIEGDEVTISFKPFIYKNCGTAALAALDQWLDLMKKDRYTFARLCDLPVRTGKHLQPAG